MENFDFVKAFIKVTELLDSMNRYEESVKAVTTILRNEESINYRYGRMLLEDVSEELYYIGTLIGFKSLTDNQCDWHLRLKEPISCFARNRQGLLVSRKATDIVLDFDQGDNCEITHEITVKSEDTDEYEFLHYENVWELRNVFSFVRSVCKEISAYITSHENFNKWMADNGLERVQN